MNVTAYGIPAAILLHLGCIGWAFGQATVAKPVTLREAAGQRLVIGTAGSAAQLQQSAIARLVADQFSSITPGNEMKPDYLQRVQGKFTFENADRIVAFAQANHLNVIGHTLCWHEQSPKWLFEDSEQRPLPRDVALANLKTHISTVVTHYKGKVKGWDVVNEVISDTPGEFLRDTPARRAIGDDYVVKAFEFAHEADPDAELYFNDYNIERDYKREKALQLIRQLKAAGVRLDGVGVQGHWMLDKIDLGEIDRGIKALADQRVNVMVSEMDVDPLPRKKGGATADLSATEREGADPYKDGLPVDVQQKLARRYGELLELLLKYPQVTRVTLWGTDDGSSWLNSWPVKGRTNHPLLFDRQLQPKPAYFAVLEALERATKAPSAVTVPSAR
jgi:endo-1,4-beta-xylanase